MSFSHDTQIRRFVTEAILRRITFRLGGPLSSGKVVPAGD